jgi:hypothetical protein
MVLGDPSYTTAWTELAKQVTDDLQRLAECPLSEQEALHHREASVTFAEYRRTFEKERILLQGGDRAGALRVTEITARGLAEQVRRSLDGTMAATRSRVLAAQGEAARHASGGIAQRFQQNRSSRAASERSNRHRRRSTTTT